MALDGLTTNNSYADVKLHHAGAEGRQDHASGTEAAPHHNDGPAAICVNQYTADGTWNKWKTENQPTHVEHVACLQ